MGVQVTVLPGAQSRSMVQVVPSQSHQRNEYGVTPPLAVAVKVTGVPTGCGAVLSAVRPVRVALVPAIAKGIDITASAASAVFPLLRTHTPTR